MKGCASPACRAGGGSARRCLPDADPRPPAVPPGAPGSIRARPARRCRRCRSAPAARGNRLPFTDHRTLRPFGIESLATATAAAEFAQRIERLAGMQALLGVAVEPLSADQGAEALQQSQGIDRCFAKSLPALLGQGSHLGAAWVDQAGIGGIAQAEWRLAGTFVDGAPGLLAATALFLDFDAVAPPQARLAGQGSLQRAFRALLESTRRVRRNPAPPNGSARSVRRRADAPGQGGARTASRPRRRAPGWRR